MRNRLKFNKRQLKVLGIFVLILTLPLTLILVKTVQDQRTSAAAPDKLEAEAGTLSSAGVTKQIDSGASGGSYVRFDASQTVTPTPKPVSSNYLANCTALDKNNWPSRINPPPALAMPGYLKSTTDPTTGVKITRVTGNPGDPIPNTSYTWRDVCGPTYPKVAAWNADESVITMQSTCIGGSLFLDARDGPDQYKVLLQRKLGHQVRWDPTDPNTYFYADVYQNTVGKVNIYTGGSSVIYTTPENNFTKCNFGNYEGGVSDDGKRTVIFCEDTNLPAHSSTRPGISFFVLDLENGKRISPVITSWDMPNFAYLDSAVISPSGNIIIAQQNYQKSVDLWYSLSDWGFLHGGTSWGLGHFDVGYDENGREIAFEAEGELVDLETGVKTSWLNVNYSHYHTSNRNIDVPGWGFANNYINSGLSPVYDGEIIATQTKPRGLIRRIVHHRSSGVNSDGSARYDAAPMATSSPDGTRVFYRSDWGNPGGPVFGFVADIRNVCGE